MSNHRTLPESREHYHWFTPITTRWHDNDLYGHVNNVTYYAMFDTVANRYLIEQGGLDIHQGPCIGLVVNSGCSYFAPIAFPDALEGGLRVNRLGRSSVEYGLAIFRKGETTAVAQGHFVHVFVDRATRQAMAMPEPLRGSLAEISSERC
ncbi:acyl-CoA thioesterase [Marinobacter sp. SS21]|uniref:acyl-CoA thioesterase n=1 Tax=Marinobacter sp. SS21 TaxID=2979460 RepID=UPI00232B4B4E|nr:thioesterase family protein [Marinobacter sp. SS21]MDC0661533.1 thioesterase family protein [Marinobacter sp. SS21]